MLDQFGAIGFKKKKPNPSAFIFLPDKEVRRIGLSTHMGARIDLAILSAFGFHYKKNYLRETHFKYHNGVEVRVPKGKFIVSINTIAEDLYFRWFMRMPQGEVFVRFYERVKKAVGRLKKSGLLVYHGYVNKRYRGTLGSVWSLEGTDLGKMIAHCPICEHQGVVLTKSTTQYYLPSGFVNAVDLIGSMIIGESHDHFRYSEMAVSKMARNRFHDYGNWINTVAKNGARGDRHVSTGAYRKSDLKNIVGSPSFLPYLILDIDGDNPIDSYLSIEQIINKLDHIGVDLQTIIASYTGGRGFHLYIPSSLFGNPVFSNAESASRVFGKLSLSLLKGIDVDHGLFNPTHLVRCIGSQHEGTGLFKTATTADNLRSERSAYSLLDSARVFNRFHIPDSTDYEPVPALVSGLDTASYLCQVYIPPNFDDVEEWGDNPIGKSVIRAMEGVDESEHWGEGKSFVGRDIANFIVACYLLRKYDMDSDLAWAELKEVNQRHNPPQPEHVLRRKLRSAQNTLGRNQKRTVHYV